MIRYTAILLLAALVADPARALTVETWNAFSRDLPYLLDENRPALEPSALPPDSGLMDADGPSHQPGFGETRPNGRMLSISDNAPLRAGIGPDLSIFADLTEAPATDVRSEPFVPVTEMPLPPSFWLLVTTLTGGLLLTRRRIAYSDLENAEAI